MLYSQGILYHELIIQQGWRKRFHRSSIGWTTFSLSNKKKIIEFFNDAWHGRESPQSTVLTRQLATVHASDGRPTMVVSFHRLGEVMDMGSRRGRDQPVRAYNTCTCSETIAICSCNKVSKTWHQARTKKYQRYHVFPISQQLFDSLSAPLARRMYP